MAVIRDFIPIDGFGFNKFSRAKNREEATFLFGNRKKLF